MAVWGYTFTIYYIYNLHHLQTNIKWSRKWGCPIVTIGRSIPFSSMTWLVFRCHDLGAPHHVVTATRHRLTPRLHWKPPRHGADHADHADDAGGCAAGGQRCPRTRAVSDLGAPAAKKGGSPSEEVSLSFFNEPKPRLW